MKKLIILSAIVMSSLMMSSAAKAQLRLNINIGAQPVWVNNSNAADYYYLPDADCYYSVKERVYVYREGNNWRKASGLPDRYKNYDFRNKKVIAINGQDKPYLHHDDNRNSYAKANEGYRQQDNNRNDKKDNRNFSQDNRRDVRRS